MTKSQDFEENGAADSGDADASALPDNERREALKKLAKYSAYSAPALLALLNPAKAFTGSPDGGDT